MKTGGAENKREKKKLLEKDASHCQKVSSLFKMVATKHDLPPPSLHDDSCATCSTTGLSMQRTVQLDVATDSGEEISAQYWSTIRATKIIKKL